MDWHLIAGREDKEPRKSKLVINSSTGLAKYCLNGLGIATLPPYYASSVSEELVQIFPDYNPPEIDFYYIYPKYLKHLEKISKFGDFLRQEKPTLKEIL